MFNEFVPEYFAAIRGVVRVVVLWPLSRAVFPKGATGRPPTTCPWSPIADGMP